MINHLCDSDKRTRNKGKNIKQSTLATKWLPGLTDMKSGPKNMYKNMNLVCDNYKVFNA